MSSIYYAGSTFLTVRAAAASWAEGALPDERVISQIIRDGEDPDTVARDLEAFLWAESRGDGALEDVNERDWRAACRAALVERIESRAEPA